MTTLAVAAAIVTLLSHGQVQASAKNKVTLSYVAPKLEVREFSGDFTQWGVKAALAKGGLQKDFRWTNTRKVSGARYEISLYPFPNAATYQPVTPLAASVPIAAPAPGTPAAFTINFAPALQELLGTSAPNERVRFYVRVVLLDGGQPISPVSNMAILEYSPPAPGTSLDQSMVLRLKSARCIRQTSGPGSDDIKITIVGAAISHQGKAKDLFFFSQDGIPDSWSIAPSHPLWTYTGLGFSPNVYIVAAVVENDTDPNGFVAAVGVNNAGHQTGLLVAQLQASTCQGGDSCLGGPKILDVTAADWNKVALGKQTMTKRLTFAGDGGSYELVFELAPR